ncbi:hypothetical protein [Mameliella alba]|nr:hypothetical protein [Mameliella alba]
MTHAATTENYVDSDLWISACMHNMAGESGGEKVGHGSGGMSLLRAA